MALPKNKSLLRELEHLASIREANDIINEYLTSQLSSGIYTVPYSRIYQHLDEAVSEELENHKEKTKANRNKSLFKVILSDYFDNYEDDNAANKKYMFSLLDGLTNRSHIISENTYSGNPYLKNIKIPSVSHNGYSTGYHTIKRYTLLPFSESSLQENDLVAPNLCLFDFDFEAPYIRNEQGIISSITPFEISVADKSLSKAAGKILTFGCGIGYYAYMASENPDVEHVTIVESSQEVIDIFEKYILPQFEHKDKIEVIHEDEFRYMRSLEDGIFDSCFINSFSNCEDFEKYFKFKGEIQRLDKTEFEFWAEKEFLINMRNYFGQALLDKLLKVDTRDMISDSGKYCYDLFMDEIKEKRIESSTTIDRYINSSQTAGLVNKIAKRIRK